MKVMKIKSVVLAVSVVLGGYSVIAQQLPESNLYTFNKYNINPAYSGYNGCLELYGSHLSQWVGLDGSPNTNYFSIHSGIGDNMGLGGGVILDNASFVSRFSAKLSYAYRVKLGEEHNLRLGLSAGLFQVKLDATSAVVDDVTDEVVSGGAQSGMNFYSDFGLYYNLKGLEIGFAIPQVLETDAKLQYQGIDGFTERRHYVGYASYDWKLNDRWSLQPSVLYKTVQSGVDQLDFNALLTFNDMISVGGGYRTHVGYLARLGVNIKDLLFLGYAYEFSGANISSYTSGSHEIMLGVKFCGKKSEEPPKSSFETTEEINSFEEAAVEEYPITEEESADEEMPVEEEIVEAVEMEQPVVVEEETDFEEEYNPEILFPYNDGENFDLSDNDDLKDLASYMKQHPDAKISIIGHACDLGSDEMNMKVSKERAESVYNELIKMGVASKQMTVAAKGESQPKYPNTSEENRKKNRRVEIVFK